MNLLLNRLICLAFFFYPAIFLAHVPASDAALEAAIVRYVNEYRTAHGYSILEMNAAIAAEARQHSRDMAEHVLPFGHAHFLDRIQHVEHRIANTNGGAENIAFNYTNPHKLVMGWSKSPGHRENIRGHYDLTGVGVARDAQGKIYYTQIFIRLKHPSLYRK